MARYGQQKMGGKIAGTTLRKVGASNIRATNSSRLTKARDMGRLGKVAGFREVRKGSGGLRGA